MQDTLINHKRDVLVQHKVQSAAIQSDLEVLAKRKVGVAALILIRPKPPRSPGRKFYPDSIASNPQTKT